MTETACAAIVASLLVTQCAARPSEVQRAQAFLTEEAALDASVPLPEGVYRVRDTGVTAPSLIQSVFAKYTDEAMRAKVRGRVVLRAIVDPAGAVVDVRVLKSLEPSLNAAAAKALALWQFRPGTRYGEPAPVAVTVQMAFVTP